MEESELQLTVFAKHQPDAERQSQKNRPGREQPVLEKPETYFMPLHKSMVYPHFKFSVQFWFLITLPYRGAHLGY